MDALHWRVFFSVLRILAFLLCCASIQAMLNFIYTDSLPDIHKLTASCSSSSTLVTFHLLAAANRYGLDRLRIFCESKLCEEVSTDTVATTLALAEQYHASQLKAICLKYAAANLAGLLKLILLTVPCSRVAVVNVILWSFISPRVLLSDISIPPVLSSGIFGIACSLSRSGLEFSPLCFVDNFVIAVWIAFQCQFEISQNV